MRNKSYIIVALAGMLHLLSSCSKVEETVQPEGEAGSFSLNVEVAQPNRLVMTKAAEVDVNGFPVVIKKGETEVKTFDSFQALKESGTLRLESGDYTVEVASKKEGMPEVSTEPFYAGESALNIQANFFTECKVTCKMQQVRVKVKLTDELINALTEIPSNVSLTNGNTDGSHTFKIDASSHESDEVYIKPTEALRLSFSATEKEYLEPITYRELLKYKDGTSPAANDALTVTIGLATGGTKAFSADSANRPLNIKLTVQ